MLTRWDPFREMMALRNQMDRMLGDWPEAFGGWGESESGGWLRLPVDLSESDEAYTVRASIPGVKPEDLDISVQNNMLTIRGETRSEQEKEGDRWHIRERRFGQFQRTIALPNNVAPDQIGAEYENGVLTLTLPKSEEAKPRRISVRSSGQQIGSQQGSGQQIIEGQAQTNR
ncbi:MAG TPA: Hsp20/alpha crystallin family protein [Caldilineaceae bacterium]|nr:Hsp20/alpha crystallin family protein [Caldilineaceae bacterium]